MPRQNDGTELFKKLDSLQVFRIATATPGDTTLAAAITAGSATANIASATNFTSGDPVFIIGSGGVELNAVTAATPATAMPLLYKAGFAQALGARFVEALASSLAHISDQGVSFSANIPLTAINSALQSLPVAYIYGYGELQASFGLLGFNIPNFHTWLGMTEAETGAGTAADPYQGVLSGASVGSQTTQCFRAQGTRQDGKNLQLDFLDARVEANGALQMVRTAAGIMPCNLRFTQAIARIWT